MLHFARAMSGILGQGDARRTRIDAWVADPECMGCTVRRGRIATSMCVWSPYPKWVLLSIVSACTL